MPQEHDQTRASSPEPRTGASDDLAETKAAIVEGSQQIAENVKAAAGEAIEHVKRAAESKIDAGRDSAAEQLSSLAGAIRKTGEELGATGGLSSYMSKAARAVDRVSVYLETRTFGQLVLDIEGFARREPAMFVGGSFLAGLIGGRFFKSASPSRSRQPGSGTEGRSESALPRYAERRRQRPETNDERSQGSRKAGATPSSAGPTSATSPTRPMMSSSYAAPSTGRAGSASAATPTKKGDPPRVPTSPSPRPGTSSSNGGSSPSSPAGPR